MPAVLKQARVGWRRSAGLLLTERLASDSSGTAGTGAADPSVLTGLVPMPELWRSAHSRMKITLIIACISVVLGFAPVADFADLDTSVWMLAAGIITAHPAPSTATFLAAS